MSGLSPGIVSDYERGKTAPSLESLEKLLSAMGCKLSDLGKTQEFIDLLRNQQWGALPALPLQEVSLDLGKEIGKATAEAGKVASRVLELFLRLLLRKFNHE